MKLYVKAYNENDILFEDIKTGKLYKIECTKDTFKALADEIHANPNQYEYTWDSIIWKTSIPHWEYKYE